MTSYTLGFDLNSGFRNAYQVRNTNTHLTNGTLSDHLPCFILFGGKEMMLQCGKGRKSLATFFTSVPLTHWQCQLFDRESRIFHLSVKRWGVRQSKKGMKFAPYMNVVIPHFVSYRMVKRGRSTAESAERNKSKGRNGKVFYYTFDFAFETIAYLYLMAQEKYQSSQDRRRKSGQDASREKVSNENIYFSH
jgi:hypothetical protein